MKKSYTVHNYMGIPVASMTNLHCTGVCVLPVRGCATLDIAVAKEDSCEVRPWLREGSENKTMLGVGACKLEVSGLPDPVEDVYYLVSMPVYLFLKDIRNDLVVLYKPRELSEAGTLMFQRIIKPE